CRALAVARLLEDPAAVARAVGRAEARFPDDRRIALEVLRALAAVYDREQALLRARRLVTLCPDDPDAMSAAADVLYRAGSFAEAERLYRQLAAQGAAEPRLRHSECLMELGRWDDASAAVQIACTMPAEDVRLRLQAARIERFRGNFEA